MFFFFKQKTAYEIRMSDWSSDVCSSDLLAFEQAEAASRRCPRIRLHLLRRAQADGEGGGQGRGLRQPGELPHGRAGALRLQIPERAIQRVARRQLGRASCRERVCQYV